MAPRHTTATSGGFLGVRYSDAALIHYNVNQKERCKNLPWFYAYATEVNPSCGRGGARIGGERTRPTRERPKPIPRAWYTPERVAGFSPEAREAITRPAGVPAGFLMRPRQEMCRANEKRGAHPRRFELFAA